MAITKQKLTEWTEGTPPAGKYMLDTGRARCVVDVENGAFEWNRTIHTIDYAFKIGKLLGPIPGKETKKMKPKIEEAAKQPEISETPKKHGRPPMTESQPQTPLPAAPILPGIDAEADAKIREALLELAAHPSERPVYEVASHLVHLYGDELRRARESHRSWKKILTIFRRNGIRVGEKTLKAKLAEMSAG
jgi:hypothetical protein